MEVWVLAGDLESFIPHETMNSELRCPVELDEMTFPFGIDEGERIDTESLHHPERSGDPPIAHGPKDRVGSLGLEREEVPEVVVCTLTGGHLVMRFGFDGVNKVGELHCILNEEDRNVVPEQEG